MEGEKKDTDRNLFEGSTVDYALSEGAVIETQKPGTERNGSYRLASYAAKFNAINSFNQTFANNLRYYLKLHNMSQKEFAEKIGVAATTVTYWVKGEKTPRMDKIDAICEVFGISQDALITDRSEIVNRELNLINSFRILDEQDKLYIEKMLKLLLSASRYSEKLTNSEN